MTVETIFDYKTPFVLNALADGEHKSIRQGVGSDFYKKSPFISEPNPARIDLTSSLSDPFESLYVKSYRQRSELDVLTLIDGSSSMTIANKPDLLTEFETSICASVAARNDNYSPYLFSDHIDVVTNKDLINAHFSAQVTENKRDHAAAFHDVERVLPPRRSLIFIVSDFHWSAEKLKHVFSRLAGHYVVPIVLWSSLEFDAYPLWRFVQIHDAETGGNRLIFVTPKQKKNIDQSFTHRKTKLAHIFQQFSCRPFWTLDEFNINDLRAYFHAP
jgi:hypothetical protein